MPLNLGYFRISQPRICYYNASTTKPPSCFGTVLTYDCFTLKYIGLEQAYASIIGNKIITLINDTPSHNNNISLDLKYLKIQDVINFFNNHPSNNYTATILDPSFANNPALFVFENKININTDFIVKFSLEAEFLVAVEKQGKLGNCKINWIKNNILFSNEISKWEPTDDKIYDTYNVDVPANGQVSITSGLNYQFFATLNSSDNDLSNINSFLDIELIRSAEDSISQVSFEPAALLTQDPIVKLNDHTISKEDTPNSLNTYYDLMLGTMAILVASNPEPYILTNTNNVLKIRYDFNENYDTYTIPLGLSIIEIVNFINQQANILYSNKPPYFAYIKRDDSNNRYLGISTYIGTVRHRIKIEKGSANPIFGFNNYDFNKGKGFCSIRFLSRILQEDHTTTDSNFEFYVNAMNLIKNNPFIGVNTNTFKLYEDSIEKIKNVDYIVSDKGSVKLINLNVSEPLFTSIMVPENDLYPNDYTIYDNDTSLIRGIDYKINTEGGWVSLITSAFPGHVYSASYVSRDVGIIVREILLGSAATIEFSKEQPYYINNNIDYNITLNGSKQTFSFEIGEKSAQQIIDTFNASAIDFKAYLKDSTKVILKTDKEGYNQVFVLEDSELNDIFGITSGSYTGTSSKGGETSFTLKNAPIKVTTFTAPKNGNTIIIKNNDITTRYPINALISMGKDFYQVKSSYIIDYANVVSTITEPYTIILNSNDTLEFTLDGNIEIKIVLPQGANFTTEQIVNEINNQYLGLAELITINNSKNIRFRSLTFGSSSKILIKNGNANRTFGLSEDYYDEGTPDTYIEITGLFKNTYINPTIYSSVIPIIFEKDDLTYTKNETPQKSNNIIMIGDATNRYYKNTIIKINELYFYKIENSIYNSDTNKTTLYLSSLTEVPIFTDTPINYTNNEIVNEGEKELRTFEPILSSEYYGLKKNNVLLVKDKDYSVNEVGKVTLKQGVQYEDIYTFDYTAKRYIKNIPLKIDYSYYDYLAKGTNVKVSYSILNPDNFFSYISHGTTILKDLEDYLNKKNKSAFNSSSSGFPVSQAPVISNKTSGSESFYTRYGIAEDRYDLSFKEYKFYDNRLKYFEDERQLLTGYIVGAENGRVTDAQIQDQNSITRLFPEGYNDVNPKRIPALDGLNKNDAGSDIHGIASTTIYTSINNENTEINNELTKLNTLLNYSKIDYDSFIVDGFTETVYEHDYTHTNNVPYDDVPNLHYHGETIAPHSGPVSANCAAARLVIDTNFNSTVHNYLKKVTNSQESFKFYLEIENPSGELKTKDLIITVDATNYPDPEEYLAGTEDYYVLEQVIIGYDIHGDPIYAMQNVLHTRNVYKYRNKSTPSWYISVTDVINAINQQIKNEPTFGFDLGFIPKFAKLNTPSSLIIECDKRSLLLDTNLRSLYILEGNTDLGFITGTHIKLRSRHELWTGLPSIFSSSALYNNINNQSSERTTQINNNNIGISCLDGQMEDWVPPYDSSFNEAKSEKPKMTLWTSNTNTINSSSIAFRDLKDSNPISAIDLDSVLNDRITSLNLRILDINNRILEINNRVTILINRITNLKDHYDLRYSWLTLMNNKQDGFFVELQRLVFENENNNKTIENNTAIINSIGG